MPTFADESMSHIFRQLSEDSRETLLNLARVMLEAETAMPPPLAEVIPIQSAA